MTKDEAQRSKWTSCEAVMMPVVTGRSSISADNLEEAVSRLGKSVDRVRFVHDLEIITVVAIGTALHDAGIGLPVGDSSIGVYVGIDDSIEDIKDDYLGNILQEGILGASPLLFPFTSPNAIAAQASIVFDMRGESITLVGSDSRRDALEYACQCISGGYARMAIAGGITSPTARSSGGIRHRTYDAQFIFIEDHDSALERGARIHGYATDPCI